MIGFSRRQFLGTAIASSAPLWSSSVFAQPEPTIDPIDAHVHVWTPDVTRFPLAENDVSVMQPASFTPQQLFAQCKPAGVKRIVLIQMSFYQYDNSYMLHAIETYPDAFRGVAIIDENKPDVPQTMRQLATQGVRGFRLYAFADRTASWPGSAAMKTMWTAGADQNLAMCLLTDPESLEIIDKMCTRHPQTPVVIDHFARIGMKGPVDQSQLDALLRLARFPQVKVKVSAFYALGQKKPPYLDLGPMIRQLRDAFGAERLMWGSDCPYQVQKGHDYRSSIELIRSRLDFLTPLEKQQILQTTAESLFFGPSPG